MKNYLKAAAACFGITIASYFILLSRRNEAVSEENLTRYSIIMIVPIIGTILVGFMADRAKKPWGFPQFLINGLIGWFVAAGMFFVVGYGVLAVKSERKPTIDELFAGHGAEAVERAKRDFNVALDGTENSLKALDQLVGQIHDKHMTNALDDVILGRECRMWGAYLGNVIKGKFAGTWERDSDINGPASFPLGIGNSQLFPCNWVYKRIVNGSEDDLTIKYRVMAMSLTNGLPVSNASSNSPSAGNP